MENLITRITYMSEWLLVRHILHQDIVVVSNLDKHNPMMMLMAGNLGMTLHCHMLMEGSQGSYWLEADMVADSLLVDLVLA
jgi:hypothetical protein